MLKKIFSKRLIIIALACVVIMGVTVCTLLLIPKSKSVTFSDWKDETIEVTLFSTVNVSTTPLSDEDGNTHAVRAEVSQTDGAVVSVFDNAFYADYAGGYVIKYSLVEDIESAPTRTVTVRIKNSDTPAPYFENTRLIVYEDEEFELPKYKIALNKDIGIKEKTLTLYEVEGEKRTESDTDLTNSRIKLTEGNYIFVLHVETENGKTGEAELAFRVRSENERNAMAALNDGYSNALRVGYYDTEYHLGATYFTKDVYRNKYVSKGSAFIDMPEGLTTAEVGVSSELTPKQLAEAMAVEGARISVWYYIDAEEEISLSVVVGNRTVETKSGRWINATFTAENYNQQDDLNAFAIGWQNGYRKFMNIYNYSAKPYTLYVDSVYVSQPIKATMSPANCNYKSAVSLNARSNQTSDFYYEFYDGTGNDRAPQMSGNGRFVSRAAGVIRAMAYPVSNRYYSDPIVAPVTVKGPMSYEFATNRMWMESGWNELPSINYSSSNTNIHFAVANIFDSGSPCYAYIDNKKIRVFEGDYILTGETRIGGVNYSAYVWITGNKALPQMGDLENFDNPSSKSNVSFSNFFSYVGDYKGASGVVKYNVTGNGAWPGFRVLEPLTSREDILKNYNENDLIALRVYVENIPWGYYSFSYWTQNVGIENKDFVISYIGEGWQTLYLSAKKLIEDYDNFQTAETFFFTNNSENHNAEVYIDWMKLVKAKDVKTEVTKTKAEYQNFNDPNSCMNLPVNSSWVLAMEWLDSYEGASGVVKLKSTYPDTWPTLKCFQPKMTKQQYLNLGYGEQDNFIIRVYNAYDYTGYTAFHNACGENIHFATLKHGWNELRLSAKIVLDNFESFKNGNAYIAFTLSDQDAKHELYLDSMYFEKNTRSKGIQTNDRADYLNPAEEKNWDWYFASSHGKQFASYDSNNNAIHYEGSGMWPDFGGFVPINSKAYYEKFRNGSFVIEMDVDSFSSQWGSEFYPKLYVKANYADSLCATISHTGKYQIEIPAATILDNWDTFVDGSSSFFYFDDGGGTVTVNGNITGMYFATKDSSYLEKNKRSKGIQTDTRADYLNIADSTNWDWYFANSRGKQFSSYDSYTKSIHYSRKSGMWPDFGGFVPIYDKEHYESFRSGNFVLEIDVKSFSTQWGEGYYPKLYVKANYADSLCADISRTGKHKIRIPAEIILDNWDSFISGNVSFFYFDDGGGTVSVDFNLTGMYFEKRMVVDTPNYIDFTDSENWQYNFANAVGQEYCSYAESATVGAETITNAIRYNTSSAGVVAGFVAINDAEYYEKYRNGKFVIDMYIADYTGGVPKVNIWAPNQNEFTLGSGKQSIVINASTILDNGNSFGLQFWNCDSLDCYFTGMYYEEIAFVDTPQYVDFTDSHNWKSYFATANGQSECSYVTSTTLGGETVANAIHYQANGQWPTISGFNPISTKENYEQYREGDFVIEMYVAGYSSQWGEGFYPKMYAKYAGNEPVIATIDHQGKYKVSVDASVILDNWDSFVNGSSMFYFDDGGGNVSVDCYFTGMYFEFKELLEETPNYLDFTDVANWRDHFATDIGQETCTYVTSTTVAGESVQNAVRYQANGQWPTIGLFKAINSKETYEQYRDGKFIIEMYVASYSSQWGAGYYPKLYFKTSTDTAISTINHTGKYVIELNATDILDNWNAFVLYFDDGGGNVSVDSYFTGMYFKKT